MELVIVSSNRAKYLHIRDCIKNIRPQIDIRCSLEFSYAPMPCDDEANFSLEEIATKKALYVMQQLQMPCLADETLLIVPSLGMNEASLSNKRSHENSGKLLPDTKTLLKALEGKEGFNRSAYLETALSLALPAQEPALYHSIARQEGYISKQEKGASQFDFGSVFIKHDYNKTMSELAGSTQIRISHRRKVLEKILSHFEKWAATHQKPKNQ